MAFVPWRAEGRVDHDRSLRRHTLRAGHRRNESLQCWKIVPSSISVDFG